MTDASNDRAPRQPEGPDDSPLGALALGAALIIFPTLIKWAVHLLG